MERKLKRYIVLAVTSVGLTLMPQVTPPAHAQDTVEPPPVSTTGTSSLRDTLRGVTQDSGNSGFR